MKAFPRSGEAYIDNQINKEMYPYGRKLHP